MTLSAIHIRDPFILLWQDTYYLYGTTGAFSFGKASSFFVHKSDDLVTWSDAIEVFHRPNDFWGTDDFWAPEVHVYKGRFYMFASFTGSGRKRGTASLVADSPEGPFVPLSDEALTPADWSCLDGTLYINPRGVPYLIFCHEWVDVGDGEICAVRLNRDLSKAEGKPLLLFRASQAHWVHPLRNDHDRDCFVTDGPFVWHNERHQLMILWSSFYAGGYAQAVAVSDNGDITGHFELNNPLLSTGDGGHGMIFRRKDGTLSLVLHCPNTSPNERAVIHELVEKNGFLTRK